jgi:hypothetical protein
MNDADIANAIGEFAASARLGVDAGFDGLELHGANGYLIEQFLNPLVNQCIDGYGQSVLGTGRETVIAEPTLYSPCGSFVHGRSPKALMWYVGGRTFRYLCDFPTFAVDGAESDTEGHGFLGDGARSSAEFLGGLGA